MNSGLRHPVAWDGVLAAEVRRHIRDHTTPLDAQIVTGDVVVRRPMVKPAQWPVEVRLADRHKRACIQTLRVDCAVQLRFSGSPSVRPLLASCPARHLSGV